MPSKVKTVFDADVQRALDKQQRLLVKQQEQINSLKTLNKTSKETKTDFDNLTSSAAKFAASAVGIAAVSAALAKVDARAKQAGASLLQQEATRQALAQIRTDPKIADRLATTLGLTVVEAQQTLFSGVSAGFDVPEIEDISATLRPIVENLQQFFNIIQQQQLQFGAVAGSPREIMNRLLEGALISTLSVEKLGPASSRTLAALTAINASPAESIAASAFAVKATLPAEAITQIRSLGAAFSEDPSLNQLGLIGAIEAKTAAFGGDIQAAGLSIGEKEARFGYKLLAENINAFKAIATQVERAVQATGTAGSPLALSRKAAEDDPNLQVILGRRRAQAVREVAFQQEGAREDVQESIFDIAIAGQQKLVNKGLGNRFQSFILDTFILALDKFTSDPAIAATLLSDRMGLLGSAPILGVQDGVIMETPTFKITKETNRLMQEQLDIWKKYINNNQTETRVVPNSAIE